MYYCCKSDTPNNRGSYLTNPLSSAGISTPQTFTSMTTSFHSMDISGMSFIADNCIIIYNICRLLFAQEFVLNITTRRYYSPLSCPTTSDVIIRSKNYKCRPTNKIDGRHSRPIRASETSRLPTVRLEAKPNRLGHDCLHFWVLVCLIILLCVCTSIKKIQ